MGIEICWVGAGLRVSRSVDMGSMLFFDCIEVKGVQSAYTRL